jgi:hypothetical protein
MAAAPIIGIPGTALVQTYETYHFPLLDGRWVTIPRGFVTDGPSIPPMFRPVVGQYDLSVEPWLIHDFLLRRGEELGLTREDADDHFEAALERQRVNPIKADLAVRAVRLRTWTEQRMREVEPTPSRGSAALYALQTALPLVQFGLMGRWGLLIEAAKIGFRLYRDARARWFSRPSIPATIEQLVALPPQRP